MQKLCSICWSYTPTSRTQRKLCARFASNSNQHQQLCKFPTVWHRAKIRSIYQINEVVADSQRIEPIKSSVHIKCWFFFGKTKILRLFALLLATLIPASFTVRVRKNTRVHCCESSRRAQAVRTESKSTATFGWNNERAKCCAVPTPKARGWCERARIHTHGTL